ncbi:MAG: oxidoreductase, partial [Labilithrix sp.]|nr:oxidoreductase [Labilithrix sp.]
ILREVVEMAYLFEQPCLLDSSDTERVLGVHASSLDTMVRDTLRSE